jgi:ATP-dependent RNA/DNA helicase IGHMBP2
MNVAVTRARRHLAIVGDSVTVSSDPYLASLINHLNDAAEIRSGFEYLECVTATPNVGLSKQQAETVAKLAERAVAKATAKEGGSGGGDRRLGGDGSGGGGGGAKAGKGGPDAEEMALGEADITRRVQYQTLLQEFVADDAVHTLELPTTLNSFERRLVHEIAPALGLGHNSTGTATARKIVVWKAGFEPAPHIAAADADGGGGGGAGGSGDADGSEIPAAAPGATGPSPPSSGTTAIAASTKGVAAVEAARKAGAASSALQICSSCGKTILKDNYEIHSLRCAREQRRAAMASPTDVGGGRVGGGTGEVETRTPSASAFTSSSAVATAVPHTAGKGKGKKGKGKGKGKGGKSGSSSGGGGRAAAANPMFGPAPEADPEAEIDALIAEMEKDSKTCKGDGCTKNVAVLGQVCQFCRKKFCFAHALAEAHGCGAEAARAARAPLTKGAVYFVKFSARMVLWLISDHSSLCLLSDHSSHCLRDRFEARRCAVQYHPSRGESALQREPALRRLSPLSNGRHCLWPHRTVGLNTKKETQGKSADKRSAVAKKLAQSLANKEGERGKKKPPGKSTGGTKK